MSKQLFNPDGSPQIIMGYPVFQSDEPSEPIQDITFISIEDFAREMTPEQRTAFYDELMGLPDKIMRDLLEDV